jgi:hypothetical protein
MPPGAARTFANTIGNMIQIYVPRAAYGYASIDMDSIIVYVERGMLRNNWIDTFKNINANTKEALQIPDETMKMWKAAFQHWLEYKSIQAANPTTELIIASGAILTEIGIKVYQCKKQNEGYVRQALEDANPEMRDQKINQPEKQEEDERRRAA